MSNNARKRIKWHMGYAAAWMELLMILLTIGFSLSLYCRAQGTCRRIPAHGFDAPTMAAFRGQYTNSIYEYAVTIPKGLVGHSSPPPAPMHGFGILLGPHKEGYLWVDGSWNALDYISSETAARDIRNYIEKRGAIVSSSKDTPWILDGIPATRITIQYKCPNGEGIIVSDAVIALSSNRAKIWLACLDTPLSRYEEDKKILEEILKSWRIGEGK